MRDWIFSMDGLGWATAVALSVLLYRKSRTRLKLSYQTASVRYFEKGEHPLPSEAFMTFRGKEVERLSMATVIVWNAGTEVLRGEDIVPGDPIRVCFDEHTSVLSHAVVGVTKEVNEVEVSSLEETPNELEVAYDHLNQDDGFVLRVVHDGAHAHPRLVGTAKGLSDGPENRGTVTLGELPTERNLRRQDWVGAMMFVCVLVYLIGWWFDVPELLGMPQLTPDSDDDVIVFLVAMILLALACSIPFLNLLLNRRRYPKLLVSHVRSQGRNETT